MRRARELRRGLTNPERVPTAPDEDEGLRHEADTAPATREQLPPRGMRNVVARDHNRRSLGESSAPVMFRNVVWPL